MNGIMELNKLSVYSFTFCLRAFLYCQSWPKNISKGLFFIKHHATAASGEVGCQYYQILWNWIQIWCCQGCSWGSPWCCWIQGLWRFWEVFPMCPFSRLVGWLCTYYHFVFWLPISSHVVTGLAEVWLDDLNFL